MLARRGAAAPAGFFHLWEENGASNIDKPYLGCLLVNFLFFLHDLKVLLGKLTYSETVSVRSFCISQKGQFMLLTCQYPWLLHSTYRGSVTGTWEFMLFREACLSIKESQDLAPMHKRLVSETNRSCRGTVAGQRAILSPCWCVNPCADSI